MATLFDNTTLPLWTWIVIIVVGAIVVIGTAVFITRLLVVRRRQSDFVDTFGDENLPQRKVTVRRGRVVEHSKYLSLTGSKFGLNAFAPDESDANSRAGARSKSPFEWWSTVKDRSQSRNSQLTQFTTTNDTASIYGLPTSPSAQRVYQRKDFNQSNTSLTSTSKEVDVSVTVTESLPASPPAIVRNFSRSFSRPGLYSKYSPRQHNTLSRIEESSPHTSMISTRQSRIASYASNGNNKRDTKSSTSSGQPQSPASTSNFPHPPRWSAVNASSTSLYHDAQQENQYHQPIQNLSKPVSPLPPPPPPIPVSQSQSSMAYNGSRSSFGEPEPRISHASNRTSDHRVDSTLSTSQRDSMTSITALPVQRHPQTDPRQTTTTTNYWDSRTDLHPVRTSSKKGNVLRKKSLKKAEIVAKLDA